MVAAQDGAVLPPAADVPQERLTYSGDVGDVFGIWFLNLLLSIISLGLYSFWGRVRMRRYLWSHFHMDGEPFEYTGTGGELFRSFLMVTLLFVLPVFGGSYAFAFAISDGPHDPMFQLGFLPAAVVTMLVLPYARYAGSRYIASRTQWQGIPFALTGSAWRYARISLVQGLLNALTLFLRQPYATARTEAYRLGTLAFGSARGKFTQSIDDAPLLPYLAFWLSLFLVYAALITLVIFFFADGAFAGMGEDGDGDPAALFTAIMRLYGAMALGALIVALVWFWYGAAILRYLANGLRLGECGLLTDVNYGNLAGFTLVNLMLTLVSGGLLRPIVIHRTMRFITERTRVGPTAALTEATRLDGYRPKRGEGLLDALDGGFV